MTLHVEDRGPADGPLAVVIHSAGLTGAETLDLFGLAFPDVRVLAPDRRNYGASPASQAGGSGRSHGRVAEVAMLEDDADAIAELLADGGHLFGYSYGGVVALSIASRYPDRVTSLALLEPPAFGLFPDDPASSATRDRIEAALDEEFATPLDHWRAFMTGAFGDPPPMRASCAPAVARAHAMIDGCASASQTTSAGRSPSPRPRIIRSSTGGGWGWSNRA